MQRRKFLQIAPLAFVPLAPSHDPEFRKVADELYHASKGALWTTTGWGPEMREEAEKAIRRLALAIHEYGEVVGDEPRG